MLCDSGRQSRRNFADCFRLSSRVVGISEDDPLNFPHRVGLSLAIAFLPAGFALAQIPPSPYVAPTPMLNPSSSLVVPQPREVPVSPSVSTGPGSLGGYGSNVFGNGRYLRGTNQVASSPRGVVYGHRYHHRHWHAQR
jgi:hypothetical protein